MQIKKQYKIPLLTIIVGIMIFLISDRLLFIQKSRFISLEQYKKISNNYSALEGKLADKNFDKANELTVLIVLELLGKNRKEDYIYPNEITSLSCQHLKLLNQLWLNNSQGNYGFSTQKEIWEQNPSEFGRKVSWIASNQKQDNTKNARGYFPKGIIESSSRTQISSFMNHIEKCQL